MRVLRLGEPLPGHQRIRFKEVAMRAPGLAILAVGTFLSSSAGAQTYAPDHPVCLHVYGRTSYYECLYTSLAQCNASASGRSAQCVVNPYFASASTEGVPLRHRRHRLVY
jgi:Protein of unknown function (DUF3551)